MQLSAFSSKRPFLYIHPRPRVLLRRRLPPDT